MRRHRRHARGDHSLCLPCRCEAAAEALPVLSMPEAIDRGDVEDLAAIAGELEASWLSAGDGVEADAVEQLRRRREDLAQARDV